MLQTDRSLIWMWTIRADVVNFRNLQVNIFVYVSKNRHIFADNTVVAFQRLCVPTRRRAADDLRIDSSFARDRFRNRRR